MQDMRKRHQVCSYDLCDIISHCLLRNKGQNMDARWGGDLQASGNGMSLCLYCRRQGQRRVCIAGVRDRLACRHQRQTCLQASGTDLLAGVKDRLACRRQGQTCLQASVLAGVRKTFACRRQGARLLDVRDWDSLCVSDLCNSSSHWSLRLRQKHKPPPSRARVRLMPCCLPCLFHAALPWDRVMACTTYVPHI